MHLDEHLPDAFVLGPGGHEQSVCKHNPGRCTFGIVARSRLGPMASCSPPAKRAIDGPGLRFRETANRRAHRLLDFGLPVRGLVLQRGPTRPGGRALRPLLGVHWIAALHPAHEAKATGAPAGRTADGRSLAILLSVWRAQRAFLPLPSALLFFLAPPNQSRRPTARPALADDLSMVLTLGAAE